MIGRRYIAGDGLYKCMYLRRFLLKLFESDERADHDSRLAVHSLVQLRLRPFQT